MTFAMYKPLYCLGTGTLVNVVLTHVYFFVSSSCSFTNKVPDFNEDLKLEMIDALTTSCTLSITPNELFFVHTLLTKHIGNMELQGGKGAHFISLVESLPKPSEKFGRDTNGSVCLPLQNSSETTKLSPRCSLREKKATRPLLSRVRLERTRVEVALKTVEENLKHLHDKIESYKLYLDNVRGQVVKSHNFQFGFDRGHVCCINWVSAFAFAVQMFFFSFFFRKECQRWITTDRVC
eukprot:m.211444 g.211444  ORF g.211444 m.211444 type:complete len:236 (+) comp13785_c3_seq25:1438-2145(+)